MIRIHHAPGSRSTRVVWLCNELGLDHELRVVAIGSPELRSDEFRAISPLGRVPAIEVDGVAMCESIAILEFLLERFGEGRLQPPAGSSERATYLQWLHFGEATAMVPVSDYVRLAVLTPEERRNADEIAGASKRVRRVAQAIDAAVADRPFIAGSEFSAADISVGYFGMLAGMLGVLPDEAETPRFWAYHQRLTSRPAFIEAQKAQ